MRTDTSRMNVPVAAVVHVDKRFKETRKREREKRYSEWKSLEEEKEKNYSNSTTEKKEEMREESSIGRSSWEHSEEV